MGFRDIYLIGLGRSGTTWLAEVINHKQNFKYLFEPLNYIDIQNCPIDCLEHIPINQENQELYNYLTSVYNGKFKDPWIYIFCGNQTSSRILVKCIDRALMIFPWHVRNFPNFSYIFLIRHPIPTALSRCAQKWEVFKDYMMQWIYGDPIIYKKYLSHVPMHIFDDSHSLFIKHVVYCCLFNYMMLKYKEEYKLALTVCFYEKLLKPPITSYITSKENSKNISCNMFTKMNHVCYMKKTPIIDINNVPDDLVNLLKSNHVSIPKNVGTIKKPSCSTNTTYAYSMLNDFWVGILSEDDLKFCETIFEMFGMHKFYSVRHSQCVHK